MTISSIMALMTGRRESKRSIHPGATIETIPEVPPALKECLSILILTTSNYSLATVPVVLD